MATPSNGSVQQLEDRALMARGKGKHTCPFEFDCDKGGFDDDGNLVVFFRNSTFRYVHMV